MALFFFLLFVSGPFCVFFFKAFPGAAALGHPIPLLSFAADLTSRAAPSCSGSSDERSSSENLRLRENRSNGRLPSTHLSIYKNPFPEESRSSRMSMSWIPGFILVLIHYGIFEIYKNILGEGS